MTNIAKSDIQEIYFEVKNRFVWVADPEIEIEYNGRTITFSDHWNKMKPDKYGVLRGDCEDFALYCSKLLKERFDLPKEKRKLTYCETEMGEGHMILQVDGKWVLDNRQRNLVTLLQLKRAGYRNFAQPTGSIAGTWEYL